MINPSADATAVELDRLRLALQSAQIGTWTLDIARQQIWWDAQCKALYGFRQDDFVSYDQVLSYMHDDDRQRVNEAIVWALNPQSGGHYDIQFRTVGVDDGQVHWLHCRGRADFDADGIAYRFAGTAQDVSQQVRIQEQLEQSETRFKSLIQQAPVAMLVYEGPDMVMTQANEQMLAIFGRGEAVLGRPLLEAVPELIGTPLPEQYRRVLATGQTDYQYGERILLIKEGQPYWGYYDYTYKALRNQEGAYYGVVCTAIDVTKQVVARQELEEVEARLRTIITNLPSATVVFRGRELIVETPSQYFIDIIDRGPDVTGKPLGELMPELESQSFLAILDEVYTSGQPFRAFGTPVSIRQEDGSVSRDFFDLIYTPLFNGAGDVYAILSVATNVTDIMASHQSLADSEARYRVLSVHLEEQVQERTQELASANEELMAGNEELIASNEEYIVINEELEEANGLLIRSNDNLQTFAYVASHDLQEPLRKIQQFGDLLKMRLAGSMSGDDLDYLERMQVAASRMSQLIRDLLTYSRIATRRNVDEPVRLNQVVTDVLGILELAIAETEAQVQVERLPLITGDVSQLSQLFQNLISNALKFRRAGTPPHIHISSEQIRADALPAAVKPARRAAYYERIEVADNGVGFDEKYLDRIFQVFQRLHGKNEFAGTGVGLAICEKVVANHGGVLTASSRPGQGATFIVYLPA